jgi:large subunit ribosomal protein L20
MSRVKRGTKARRRRKKLLKEAKGYYGARSRTYKKAAETLARARKYAYRDRRTKKRLMRRLWITRINAAARLNDLSYSQLFKGLKKAEILLDRKVLADIAVYDAEGFKKITEIAKENLMAGLTPSPGLAPQTIVEGGSQHA